jgi:hypothetical protein
MMALFNRFDELVGHSLSLPFEEDLPGGVESIGADDVDGR